MKTLMICIVLIVSGALIPVAYKFITESSVLSVRTIHVKTGHKAKPEEMQLYLREFIGRPLYGVNLKAVQLAALKHPWVSEVTVRRQPPSELEVEIIERQPLALIKREKLWVVDARGVSFKTAENEAELALPLVTGAADVGVLVTHLQAKQPGGAILEVQPYGIAQHRVIFSNGLEVIIGDKNSLEQWQKLIRVLNSLGEKQNTLAFVYLDDTPKRGQIAVRFKKG
jgi:cell division septal protein FtsQ